ncbi:PT domain-containing protein [Streptomyces sp. NPDC048639]|uniref:PT domain-containing protein n=1 Tax=Streptomyces sp. NPDC048639 TaxID=3365581 RepID=UPI003712748A
MNTGRFEERLLQELKTRIAQQPAQADAAKSAAFAPAEPSARGRVLRVGLAAGVAVAMVGTAVLIGQTGPGGSGGTAADSRAEDGGSRARIVNAAYTVERKETGVVKLTIEDPSGRPDIDGMRKDLESMGVPARVYAGDPDCPTGRPDPSGSGDPDPTGEPTGEPTEEPTGEPSGEPTEEPSGEPTPSASTDKKLDDLTDGREYRITEEHGKLVAYIRPHLIPEDTTLTLGFPLAKTEPDKGLAIWQVGLAPGDGPDCIPAIPRGVVERG